MSINPLATPKGVQLECELCGKVAHLQCEFCSSAYYCCPEHRSVDWVGIHEKICTTLQELRAPKPLLASAEDRSKRAQITRAKQLGIISTSQSESKKFLISGDYHLAIPGALQALRFSTEVYGIGSLELIQAYLLLGAASIGQARYSQAEEYLSLAKWTILQHPDCSYDTRALLHEYMGKLFVAQQDYTRAIEHLSLNVYYASVAHGPKHIRVASAYFFLGNVFSAREQDEAASALFHKTLEIWLNYLSSVLTIKDKSDPDAAEDFYVANKLFRLSESHLAEGVSTIKKLISVFDLEVGQASKEYAQATFCLGMIFALLENNSEAVVYLCRSLGVLQSQMGAADPKTQLCRRLIDQLGMEEEQRRG